MGGAGCVTYGVQFLPVPNTLASRSFFSCFILLAFCTRSIYFCMPTLLVGTEDCYLRVAGVLLCNCGLNVRFSSSNSLSILRS